jgi:hypothetical protein
MLEKQDREQQQAEADRRRHPERRAENDTRNDVCGSPD